MHNKYYFFSSCTYVNDGVKNDGKFLKQLKKSIGASFLALLILINVIFAVGF
jgi:hypothetical protein